MMSYVVPAGIISFRPGWMIGLPEGASLVFGAVKAVAKAAKPAKTVAVEKYMTGFRLISQLGLLR